MDNGKTPLTGRNIPSSPNSPIIIYSPSISVLILPLAPNMPIAMERSYPLPSFFMSAGERLTVISATGIFLPIFINAAFIRSKLSFTAASASPETRNNTPGFILVSMVTVTTPNPISSAEYVFTSMEYIIMLLKKGHVNRYTPLILLNVFANLYFFIKVIITELKETSMVAVVSQILLLLIA